MAITQGTKEVVSLDANKTGKNENRKRDRKPKKPLSKKKVGLFVGGCVAAGAVAAAIFFGLSSSGQKNPDDAAAAFVEATYKGDLNGLWGLFPEQLKRRGGDDVAATWGLTEESEKIEKLGRDVTDYLELLTSVFGEGWGVADVEVASSYAYNDEELNDLSMHYQMMGVSDMELQEAKLYLVDAMVAGLNGTTGTETIRVPLVKVDGGWYIGQCIGTVCVDAAEMDMYDIYGDWMDGYSITGILDETPETTETVVDGQEGSGEMTDTVPEDVTLQDPITEDGVSGNDVSENDVVVETESVTDGEEETVTEETALESVTSETTEEQ